MTHPSVKVQIAPLSAPTTPSWFAEVVVLAHVLTQFGVLDAIEQRVRFARARFGHYDTIDFVVVLIGYAVSGEATLKAFYERLRPFAPTFMALFGRNDLPCHSTLSRFLASLDQPSVEALRLLFRGGIWWHDRRSVLLQAGCGIVWETRGGLSTWMGRVLLPDNGRCLTHQIFLLLIAVLIRSVLPAISDANAEKWYAHEPRLYKHIRTNAWGPMAGAGNGDYRAELLRARAVIVNYATQLSLPLSQVLIRLDGLYGNAAPLADLLAPGGPGVVVRGKDYHLLDLPAVKKRLQQPPDRASGPS